MTCPKLALLLLAALLPAALASPAGATAAQEVPAERLGTVSGRIQVAPAWLRLPTGERFDTPNPVARALEFAAPGAELDLLPGAYPPLKLGFANRDPDNARTSGGLPSQPIVVRGRNGVRFEHRGRGDTVAVAQNQRVAHVWFEYIDIEPGQRTGVMFYDLADDQAHEGFRFYDCRILGGWDHATGTGVQTKWGVVGHDLSDFVFAGRARRAVVQDIRLEHAFYLQSPRGDITLENIDAKRLGRCFVQLVARARSGPPGRGLVVVRGNEVSDTGISDWDGYKGGTAFTFAGGLEYCTVLVEKNRYRAGFDPKLLELTTPGMPYGTAALVAWDGGEARPNGKLVLRGNDFELAEGAGDRPLVSIGACERVQIEADNRFVSGAHPVALELRPTYDETRSEPRQNGRIYLAGGTTIDGTILYGATEIEADVRRRLETPVGER